MLKNIVGENMTEEKVFSILRIISHYYGFFGALVLMLLCLIKNRIVDEQFNEKCNAYMISISIGIVTLILAEFLFINKSM